MAIKITKPTDPILTENLIIVLFGQPGVGKTSLGFSTTKPILLDFDLGSQRALGRKDVVQVKHWSDISELAADDLKDFNTIIVDTAGRLLEAMEIDIKNSNPKMINRMNGGLSLPGYGLLNSMFKNFMLKLKSYGKDIVLICHDKEEKQGENLYVRPDAIGSSRIELTKMADLMGYMFMNGKKRFIDFNPTENHLGKNCAEIPEQEIPNLNESKEFLADLIAFTKNKMNVKSEAMIKIEQEFNQGVELINAATTHVEFNNLIDNDIIKNNNLLKLKLVEAGNKNFIFNKTKRLFEIITPDSTVEQVS
jgi:hypothetical protein